ncbi:transcription factor MafF [Platysternon megacephalum]|uniref:Transcription factor MafF n=1 Tax=Platysternon megacephalum TaxID=55544 RepID=A0A4D9EP92_9SAUR|nr:transcription factor MafF [Platysternon megacephalum]
MKTPQTFLKLLIMLLPYITTSPPLQMDRAIDICTCIFIAIPTFWASQRLTAS